jgi:hypothetical protein
MQLLQQRQHAAQHPHRYILVPQLHAYNHAPQKMKAQYDIAPRWRDVAPHSAIAPHLFAGANGVPNGSDGTQHFWHFGQMLHDM